VPTYEYRCEQCGETTEAFQKMSDDPLEVCERCGGRLRRVLHPVAIHFKGSGFYTTDYGRSSKSLPAKESGEPGGSDGSIEATAEKAGKTAESAKTGGTKKTEGGTSS
jgi:putative FmdB family regulatory protein